MLDSIKLESQLHAITAVSIKKCTTVTRKPFTSLPVLTHLKQQVNQLEISRHN